jgi:hypothetical protein
MGNEHCGVPGPQYSEGWQGYATSTPELCFQGSWCSDDYNTLWTLSRSSTNPYINLGALPAEPSTLYVWLACERYGMLGAAFSLQGDIEVLSVTPVFPVTNDATFPDFHLTFPGCPNGPFKAFWLEVQPGAPSSVGEPRSSWGRVKSLYGSAPSIEGPWHA